MPDFRQGSMIATLHMLGEEGFPKIERELIDLRRRHRTTVVIPALFSDFARPAMKQILRVLEEVEFIQQIVIALGGTSASEFQAAKAEVKNHPLSVTLLWMDNPRLRKLLKKIQDADLYLGPDGKGKSCWTSFGFVLAQGRTQVIALHDSDIKTYSKEMLARLIYPVVNPNLTFLFSKGYYARFTTKLHGRVTRLFIAPLFHALETVVGAHPFLRYLNAFRYPLAGEFALDVDLVRVIRFPGDWGLEVTTLYEIYRNIAEKRICQVEIARQYDHKHQALSPKDSGTGLHKMVLDISLNILKNLSAEGIVLSWGLLKTLQKTYRKSAEDIIANYHADAMINGLTFDRHEEESYVDTFTRALITASERFLRDPVGPRMLPNWNRITSAYPDFLAQLLEIVSADNDREAV
ncbi:MAG: glycosyl transferase [Candidatus Aminicenantes bacterium]|nr:glycosyl transferase [Candidatus Aminicenantes bacterium]